MTSAELINRHNCHLQAMLHRTMERFSLFNLEQREDFMNEFRKIIRNVQAGKLPRLEAAVRTKRLLKRIDKAQQKTRRDLQLPDSSAKTLHYHKAVQPLLKTHDRNIWLTAYEVTLDAYPFKGVEELNRTKNEKKSSIRESDDENDQKNSDTISGTHANSIYDISTATLLEHFFPGFTSDFNVTYHCQRYTENPGVDAKVSSNTPFSSSTQSNPHQEDRELHHSEKSGKISKQGANSLLIAAKFAQKFKGCSEDYEEEALKNHDKHVKGRRVSAHNILNDIAKTSCGIAGEDQERILMNLKLKGSGEGGNGAVIILLTKLIFGLLCLPLGKRGVRILLGRFRKSGCTLGSASS